jgi:lipopolysaccharide transport system ATP-binding protein
MSTHAIFRPPARFLNEGTYRLELIAVLHNRTWLMQPGVSAPQVTLVIQGGLSDSPNWVAKRPGILGPVLNWTRMN